MNGKKGCQILSQVSQRRSGKTCHLDKLARGLPLHDVFDGGVTALPARPKMAAEVGSL